jgi:hypothetical protein
VLEDRSHFARHAPLSITGLELVQRLRDGTVAGEDAVDGGD